MSAPTINGSVSEWHESSLGRSAADIDDQLTAILTDPHSWVSNPARSQSIAELHADLVRGEPIETTTERIVAWRTTRVACADRRGLLEEMGRASADGFGYPIAVTLQGGLSRGLARLHIGFSSPTHGRGVQSTHAERERFGTHVLALLTACGVETDVAPSVVDFEFLDARSRATSVATQRCTHPVLTAVGTAALRRAGASFRAIETTADDGVCNWLESTPLPVLQDLLTWGAVHHSAPFVPALSALNFGYHSQASGAVIPRTPAHRATGFCKRAFTSEIAAELRERHAAAPDDVVQNMFGSIRSAMADLVRAMDPTGGTEKIAQRLEATTLATTTHLGQHDDIASTTDLSAESLFERIRAVNPAGLTARIREPLPAWDIAFFDHRTLTVHIGIGLIDTPRLLTAREYQSSTAADFARLGFVIGHELAHCVVPRHGAAGSSDDPAGGAPWSPSRWLAQVSREYARHTGDTTGRTVREDAADLMGLAAAVTAARRHPTAAASGRADFMAHWAGYWDHSLPTHELERRRSSGSHSAPDVRRAVPPTLLGRGAFRLESESSTTPPARDPRPVIELAEEVMTW
ncbi:hypothetical protein ACQ7HM_08290 [Williamsia sp. MIQD14]|uniref:hypothetical protein n=1 Tax=Williamsia sp. MIQD14 TaxID=3425703 RepID=UPI003D9FF023